MSADNLDSILPNSTYPEISLLRNSTQLISQVDWTNSLCTCTLIVICIAVLLQNTWKARNRIKDLEAEVQVVSKTQNMLQDEIEALIEEIKLSREIDREEKLCLVENVKQVLRQERSSSLREESNTSDQGYTGYWDGEDNLISNYEENSAGGLEDNSLQMRSESSDENMSCPWCSHAHMLKLGGCNGDDTCDGSVHIPYCPSCFYKESVEPMKRQDEICSDAGTTDGFGRDDWERPR